MSFFSWKEDEVRGHLDVIETYFKHFGFSRLEIQRFLELALFYMKYENQKEIRAQNDERDEFKQLDINKD